MDQIKNLNLTFDKKPTELNDDGNHGFLTVCKINRNSGITSKAAILNVQKIKGLKTNNFNISGINYFKKDQFIFEGYYTNGVMSKPHLRLTNVFGFLTHVNLK
jgi:hypothetical protein